MKNIYMLLHEDGTEHLTCDCCATAQLFKELGEIKWKFKLHIVPVPIFTTADYNRIAKDLNFKTNEQKSE